MPFATAVRSLQVDPTLISTVWTPGCFALFWLERAGDGSPLARDSWGFAHTSHAFPWPSPVEGSRLRVILVSEDVVWNSRLSAWFLRQVSVRAIVASDALPSSRRAWWREWSIDPADPIATRLAWLEAETLLLRLESSLPVADLLPGTASGNGMYGTPSEAIQGRVETMMRELARRFQEPLTVGAVCRAAGLPAEHGASLFRRATGHSVLRCLRRLRIMHACHLLSTTERKVVDIAHESGFETLSRFYEAFQRETGSSPRELRQRDRAQVMAARLAVTFRHGRRATLPTRSGSTGGRGRDGFPLVLWVDDVPSNNFDERLFFHALGVFTDCHLTNASALAALEVRGASLIISDLHRQNEKTSGWDLLANLRQREDAPPLLFYTGHVDTRLTARTREAGAAGVYDRSRPLIEHALELLAGAGVS